MPDAPFFKRHAPDIFFLLIILIFSIAIQQGRIGSTLNGVNLTTDAANYAAMAAATAHPEAFAKDDAFSDPAIYGVHTTIFVPLISLLAEEGNFGLAYLKLTGVHVFVHYLTFYLLGLMLFKRRWQAMLFTLLMGQVYWIPWGTYWGNGYPDYTPRSTFSALYPLYLMAALALLRKPRGWPLFMAATGLLVYVHSISTLPVALGFWLGFALHRPPGVGRGRHMAWLCFCGLCFLAALGPFALSYMRPTSPLSAEDVRMLRDVLWTRYDHEFTLYWQGMADFFWNLVKLPLIPMALTSAWIIHRWGTPEERDILGQFAMWTLGVLGVVAFFVVDQEAARILGRHHYEFDLIRVLRFLIFFSISVAFLGINVLVRLTRDHSWPRRLAWFLWMGLFIGLFLGGQQDQARLSLLWYWNRLEPARYEAAYGPTQCRAEMIDALKSHTEPGAAIFYAQEDLAIRHNALRSLTYSWKDVGAFYYSRNVDKLRRWKDLHARIHASPTAYMEVGRQTGADYLLSDRPQDIALLRQIGPVVWSNDRYVLVRLPLL